MIIYLPLNKPFRNRKQAKNFLGGTNKYNIALNNGQILFIDDDTDDVYLKELLDKYNTLIQTAIFYELHNNTKSNITDRQ